MLLQLNAQISWTSPGRQDEVDLVDSNKAGRQT
jgi:hypothetical protein